MAKFDPPPKFSFRPNEWLEWIEEFGRFRTATKLHKEDGDVQRDSLLYSMGGREANRIFRTLTFVSPEKDTEYDTLVSKLTEYFIPKRNIIHERCVFQDRVQTASETVEEFLRDLQALAQHCAYSDTNEMIRDRFVMGINDPSVKQKLQLVTELSLDKAVMIARQNEQVKMEMRVQLHEQVAEAKIVSRTGTYASREKRSPRQKPISTQNCDRCGYSQHGRDGRCPAAGQKCKTCNGRGHFAAVCRSKSKQKANRQYRSAHAVASDEPHAFLGVVHCADKTDAWFVNLTVKRSKLKFKIDTGADVTVITKQTWLAMTDRPRLERASVRLNSVGGQLRTCGQFLATSKHKDIVYRFKIVVIEGDTAINLLAREVAADMGLVCRLEKVEVSKSNDGRTSSKSSKSNDGVGLMKTEPVTIKLTSSAEPHCLTTARRVPFPLMDAVKAELNRMVASGVIREVTEPTDWCSAMVPVVKKTGAVRICVDLKQLNKAVRREHLMLPSLDDISPNLSNAKVFSTLDAASGFWQIPLDEDSQLLTTFITPFGRYAFRRLPFGISSAPEIFQKKMSALLDGLSGVEVIMDDILVYGRTIEEHDDRLEIVMGIINDSGLKLNTKKCTFRKHELTYFGHLVGADGIKPDPSRVKALLELSPPENISELRMVLGMFQYLAKFVFDMSSIMKPMTELLKSDVAWSWGDAQQLSFNQTKERLATTPTLSYYDSTKSTVVSADASSFGIGAVLMQYNGDDLKPVAFASRTLTTAEQRYAQIEKECLAGVWACEKFARYLVGLSGFKLLTDHRPLVPLMNTKRIDEAPLRCQRLLMRAMRFNPVVEYVPGKQLVIADALSRKPLQSRDHHDDELELSDDIEAHIEAVQQSWPVTTDRLAEIREETSKDPVMTLLSGYIEKGWPKYERSVPQSARTYYNNRTALFTNL